MKELWDLKDLTIHDVQGGLNFFLSLYISVRLRKRLTHILHDRYLSKRWVAPPFPPASPPLLPAARWLGVVH